jgi:hypothetical protein
MNRNYDTQWTPYLTHYGLNTQHARHLLCIWQSSNANYWAINSSFMWLIVLPACFDTLTIYVSFTVNLTHKWVYRLRICLWRLNRSISARVNWLFKFLPTIHWIRLEFHCKATCTVLPWRNSELDWYNAFMCSGQRQPCHSCLNYIKNFTSCFTENTLRPHYKYSLLILHSVDRVPLCITIT